MARSSVWGGIGVLLALGLAAWLVVDGQRQWAVKARASSSYAAE